ncbi:GIY-YIG nuclease family protein [Brucella sp. HL-2]|nr:GIY-YIG nuclease family protein [Brucella sp. HL-2]MCV9909386.1 GIY-YIG nuclease family protein [Brucella sp. HL-2]
MSVYKRDDTHFYSYDFRMDGKRYSGSTLTVDLEEAKEFERAVKEDAQGMSITCRSVLRRAAKSSNMIRQTKYGYVYMIKSGYFVKVGHSHDPSSRFRSIRTATPDDCEILFYMPGSVKLEKRLHREFASCHYKKEWFFLCGKLKKFVQEFEDNGKTKNATRITVSDFSNQVTC